jgi:hypothetical protein
MPADATLFHTEPVDDPELWDEERLGEELGQALSDLSSATYYRDKYDTRRKALAAAIAPVVASAQPCESGVLIPTAVWEALTSDLDDLRHGRIPPPRS